MQDQKLRKTENGNNLRPLIIRFTWPLFQGVQSSEKLKAATTDPVVAKVDATS